MINDLNSFIQTFRDPINTLILIEEECLTILILINVVALFRVFQIHIMRELMNIGAKV